MPEERRKEAEGELEESKRGRRRAGGKEPEKRKR